MQLQRGWYKTTTVVFEGQRTASFIKIVDDTTLEYWGRTVQYKSPYKDGAPRRVLASWHTDKSPQSYRYTIVGNRVSVPEWGQVFTVSDGALVPEVHGSSYCYYTR